VIPFLITTASSAGIDLAINPRLPRLRGACLAGCDNAGRLKPFVATQPIARSEGSNGFSKAMRPSGIDVRI
jgi:hypothetical protein